MADKIKSFFQKKKADAKFMNAGKGYKLTEASSSSAASTNVHKVPIKRTEPSQEAKLAGQAALARFESKTADKKRFNVSYAAIQARVKRELELEKEVQQVLDKMNVSETKQDIKERDSSVSGVSDIFFRCPYMSDEILTWDEWKKRIKEFLYEQLKEEEAGLTACLIIQNCNSGQERIENCVDTLGKYLDNILNNPEVEKYRKIRMSNRIFQEKVLPIEGALEFLKAAGFEQKKLLNNNEEEDFLVWNPERCSMDNVSLLSEALISAERIPIELDRNLQVLMPCQVRQNMELPDSFFALSTDEIKKEQKLRMETIERNQMLRTRAMREKDEQRELKIYKFTLIRIRFPDNILLQGTFSVYEKYKNVVEFVEQNLIDPDTPFLLTHYEYKTFLQDSFDKTLLELKLVPSVELIFSWDTNELQKVNAPSGYLKDDVLCFIKDM